VVRFQAKIVFLATAENLEPLNALGAAHRHMKHVDFPTVCHVWSR